MGTGIALPSESYGYGYGYDYGYGIDPDILAGLGIGAGAFLIIIGIISFIAFIVGIICYIFQAIGIAKMHKKLNLSGGWMAFIPVLNLYAYGKVAQQYIKKNGKSSANFSVILLLLYFLDIIVAIFSALAPSLFGLSMYGTSEETVAVSVIGSLLLSLVTFTFTIIYTVVTYVALWRIYAIFSKNATLMFVLTLFFPIIQPFVIFAIRNKEPSNVQMQYNYYPDYYQQGYDPNYYAQPQGYEQQPYQQQSEYQSNNSQY